MNVNLDLSIFYVLICFFIVFFVAKNTLLKRLDQILAERHKLIEGSRKQAEGKDELIEQKIAQMNAALAEAREKAFNKRAGAREEAMKEQTQIVEQAREESRSVLEKAQTELQQSVADARGQLESESEAFARSIADSLLRRSA